MQYTRTQSTQQIATPAVRECYRTLATRAHSIIAIPGWLLVAVMLASPMALAANPGSAMAPPFAGEQAMAQSPPLPTCRSGNLLRWDQTRQRFRCVAAANCRSNYLLRVYNGALSCQAPPKPPAPPVLPPSVGGGIFGVYIPPPAPKPKDCLSRLRTRESIRVPGRQYGTVPKINIRC